MYFVLNVYAGVLMVLAAFVAIFLLGNLAAGEFEIVQHYYPYMFAGWLIALDLAVRFFHWRRIVARQRQSTVLTPQGPVAARRDWFQEVFEAIASNETGGQFFYVVPAWVGGIGIIVLALLWQNSYLSWILNSELKKG